jgi:hypothetical protein
MAGCGLVERMLAVVAPDRIEQLGADKAAHRIAEIDAVGSEQVL